ncbi:MAG: NAD(+)/NADH kinase [Deltaproteobacteria bacterium]|jgi:NAD+ kinase|nr:NAD(+)/NADH kinase [Deltaproteobacteria bacterium]
MSASEKKQSLLLIVKPRLEEASVLAQEIPAWLEKKNCAVCRVQADEDYADMLARRFSLVVVLGGDGTLLDVARRFVPRPTPLLGLNFGKVGFLAEAHSAEWREILTLALEGRTFCLERMALAFEVVRNGERVFAGCAVNEVVLNRGRTARLINLDIAVQDFALCRIRADGLIIASPQGCSGYGASAGGPLMHPDIQALCLVPICPYFCNFPPLILPYPQEARVTLPNNTTEIYLTVDGQEGYALRTDDCIHVRGLPGAVHFVGRNKTGYLTRLKARGFLAERPENL